VLREQNVLEHFTVDRNNTRVAVITFSTTTTVDINDLETDDETKCTLYRRLDNLVAKHAPYGYTATHDALQVAATVSARTRYTNYRFPLASDPRSSTN